MRMQPQAENHYSSLLYTSFVTLSCHFTAIGIIHKYNTIYETFDNYTSNRWQITNWLIRMYRYAVSKTHATSKSMDWTTEYAFQIVCSHLFGLMLINDIVENTLSLFHVYDEWAHVQFCSSHALTGTESYIENCLNQQQMENEKYSMQFRACKPLSIQYLLIQQFKQESVDAITHLFSSQIDITFLSLASCHGKQIANTWNYAWLSSSCYSLSLTLSLNFSVYLSHIQCDCSPLPTKHKCSQMHSIFSDPCMYCKFVTVSLVWQQWVQTDIIHCVNFLVHTQTENCSKMELW